MVEQALIPLRSQRQVNFWVLNQQRLHSETLTQTSTKVNKYERALELERVAGWCHLAELPAAAVPCCLDCTRRPRGSLIAQQLRCLTSILLLFFFTALFILSFKNLLHFETSRKQALFLTVSPLWNFSFFHLFSFFFFFFLDRVSLHGLKLTM